MDLTILERMDGEHSLQDIIDAVSSQFAHHFGALSVRDYVAVAVDEYQNPAAP